MARLCSVSVSKLLPKSFEKILTDVIEPAGTLTPPPAARDVTDSGGASDRRGRRVALPEEFLRHPGWTGGGAGEASGDPQVAADARLAMMLQVHDMGRAGGCVLRYCIQAGSSKKKKTVSSHECRMQ